jgi:nucleoside 2-deoxyribosyltransferase
MRVYLAGPLFTSGERWFNAELTALLRAAGHEVFLPQDQEIGKKADAIFRTDVTALDWADVVVANMDGPDPDSGTCWECGYAYGKMPIVLLRTDFRKWAGEAIGDYNPMLTESADAILDLVTATPSAAAAAVLPVLARLPSRHAP